MQVNGDSATDCANAVESKVEAQKKLVEQLRVQWKLLWIERFNDRVRAEAVSAGNYESLRVQRGTVIHATRDFKPLVFKEILDEHRVENPDRYLDPSSHTGGWNKFIKTQINTIAKPNNKHVMPEVANNKKSTNQTKKSGRGWLHAK